MRSKLLILVSLILVGMSAYGLSGLLQPQQTALNNEVERVPTEPTVTYRVWYAKRPLQQGEIAKRDHLAIKSINQADAFEAGFDGDVALEIWPDMVAQHDIAQGRYVIQSDFVAPHEDGYVELTLRDGYVPFPIEVSASAIIGGIIRHGSVVDIVAMSSTQNNLARDREVGNSDKSLELRPVLIEVPVLQVIEQEGSNKKPPKVSLILELTRRQVATMSIARQLASIEVHKSVGQKGAEEMLANSGDVLPNFRAITELRAETTVIK
ncbi:Flp pilus assembly protein CpaB [Ferrimonas pelagia]|uniref:Flp pilus assembly protein CpaB n=1 Tax=Ferrimonas pelagia TaxID=1177826 RepID=A0ABP9FGF8_9GAMM